MIFINNLSPVLIEIGPVSIQWYGFLLSTGIIIYYLLTKWMFKREGYHQPDVDGILIYSFFGLVTGARLGEIFFYDPSFYFTNPFEIIKIWRGGLSSHGAATGLFIAYLLWTRFHKIRFTRYIDILVIGIPVNAALVRVGNFFNSEIVGKPVVNIRWGVIFKNLGEDFPRHPAQLYEAALCLIIFAVLFQIYRRYYKKTPALFFLFLFMLLYFSSRFIIEFWKDLHVMPGWFPLSMGQVLSIVPLFLASGYFILVFPKQNKRY